MFIQRVMAVWNLNTTTQIAGIELGSGRWPNPHQGLCRSRPTQTSTLVYSFLLGFCNRCKPQHQEHWLFQAVEGAETVFSFVILKSL